ncbi:M2 family metallopeptidase [Shewanella sp. UCD-KL12]|uniref:M2 family metallopeptidase n=1 Tax=Shewanella sp. UCD-KL12 TaxID=1917163 RepID=UPI0009712490|nr:M2 family metallopeptidase [Shewanella sp. UCD-KL12]
MRKSIFLIALSFSLTFSSSAAFAASPLPLLIEQCLQLQAPVFKNNLASTYSQTLPEEVSNERVKADTFEASLLSLFNIKDRLAYYKKYPLPALYQEHLLQCQLHLADLMAETINSPWLTELIAGVENHDDADQELTLLATRLKYIQTTHLAIKEKSRLHTAQASIKKGLRDQQLALTFHSNNCQLANVSDAGTNQAAEQDNFNINIANYLILQNDPVCQKLVWQAYQGRAAQKNRGALQRVKQLKNQQALQSGFDDYSSFALKDQLLSSTALVKQFLQTQTSLIATPPWQFGQQLANSAKTPIAKTDIATLQAQIELRAQTLGFKFEHISSSTHRVWLNGRLLGDIYIKQAKQSRSYTLKSPVLGRQFGQVQLNLKEEINRFSHKLSVIEAYALALTSLSGSSHYYLVNTLGETIDSSTLGQRWLSLYLSDGILLPREHASRESLMDKFSKQQKVFRAKVALNFYSSPIHRPYEDLSEEFTKSFNGTWDNVEDYPYNFYALVSSGPLYYQELWQDSLANYIYKMTKRCKNPRSVYNTLLINEESLPLDQRLRALIGDPVDASSLIKRIHDDFSYSEKHSQDQYTVTCATQP